VKTSDTVPLATFWKALIVAVQPVNASRLGRVPTDIQFAKLFKDNRPDIAIAHQSVELCRTAFGLGIPIILTADTPHALATNRLTIPFAHTVVVSEALPKSFT
jgi:predicted glycosyltransferase